MKKCVEIFNLIYDKEPDNVAFCPYRICPIGAHSDHQLGKITGLAIDKGIYIAYSKNENGNIELKSMNFEKPVDFHVNAVPQTRELDWADYLRGATISLAKVRKLDVGLSAVIEGSLPIGGLSSSASVIICFLKALCNVNNVKLTDSELISVALEAENKYVGVSCGKLDQSCEVFSRKDHLLYLDTKDDSFEVIPTHKEMKPYKIAIFFSGIERSLASSKFNMRVDECKSAAYALMAFSGKDYGKFDEAYLRNVPEEVFHQYKNRLPENWMKRAEHWYSEFNRVEQGAKAWKNGDLERFGSLSFQSGYSSIYNYETGSDELKELYEIMTRCKGIYGGRFSGAGFKGCCMALIDPNYEEEILYTVQKEYIKKFPELEGKYTSAICTSADGVSI